MAAVTRPALRYHGGKFKLAPWIISHFPEHGCYVEPYGSAASVLLRKPRTKVEIWNDLDGRLVNLFRILRGPRAVELIAALQLTPYARAEYDLSWEPADDPVENARRLIVRSFMGISPVALGRPRYKSFRVCRSNDHTNEWTNYPRRAGRGRLTHEGRNRRGDASAGADASVRQRRRALLLRSALSRLDAQV
jgi:DNA adenine methylase